MEENANTQGQDVRAPKAAKEVHFNFRKVLKKWWYAIRAISRLNEDTDVEATLTSIHKAVEFRGVNIWILAFAIIVASVGLNVNSTAVIIGAMLISPLMGPINGVGLAIGISDSDLLKKSLKNLIVMVLISLLASTTYFFLTPLSDAQSELLARTTPTIFDVLIAFFGGMAGIVAISRKEQPFAVISGVAIATALMPPLCTAGYGLATLQFNFFFGAFYLFFINSFFIALATFIMVRYLRFPQKKYLDETRRKMVKRMIYFFSIVVLTPSIFMAFSVVKEASFNTHAIQFINDIQKQEAFKDVQLVSSTHEYHRDRPVIQLSLVGRTLSNREIGDLRRMLPAYGLDNTKLSVRQTGGVYDVDAPEFLENLLNKKEMQLMHKDSLINQLEQKIEMMDYGKEIYEQLGQEMAIQYPQVSSFSIANTTYYDVDTKETKTIPTLYVTWENAPSEAEKDKLVQWLKVRLNLQNLRLMAAE